MNSTFRTRWLASSEVISQVLFTSEQLKKNKKVFVAIFSQIKLLFGPLVIQLTSVVYTKTIIHFSVGESGGYLPRREYSPPLRWMIVKYYEVSSYARAILVRANSFKTAHDWN